MSFPLLLQQQGVQLRSWHRMAPSRLLCRTCLLVRRQHQEQLYTKPSLGSRNYGVLGNHCQWNALKQQQQQHQQLYVSSPMHQPQRHLHLTTPEIDTRLQELTTLLAHPPTPQKPLSITRRNYRNRLSTLYESIRRDLTTWNDLTSVQLMALYNVLRPSINDPSLSILMVNAQHVLQDIQQRTPQRFGLVHVEALLSNYHATGQVDDTLALVDWAKANQLSLSLTAYECLIATLTTTTRTTLTRNNQQYRPMDLALQYWEEAKKGSDSMETLELMTGYMMQGILAQGDLMRAASWLKTHTHPSNVAMQQKLDQWKTATLMGGDDHYYAMGVVSYGLEKLMQQTARLDRFTDARLFYQQQCRLFSSNKTADLQQKQSTVGLLSLANKCIATNRESMMQQLLQDTLDLGHDKGTKVMAHRILHYWLSRNHLRRAIDLYFRLATLEQQRQLPRCFERNESHLLLLRCAKAKYQTDMYRLYQRFITLYPSSLDLRTYTHILQTLIRTKQYDEARIVLQDATHNPLVLSPTGSSASAAAYTKRLFHLAYSLCAQVGDLDLLQSTVDMQRKAGFPELHHHTLTSLMAAYVKAENTASAKMVFDHLAHRLGQQPTSSPAASPRSMNAMDSYGDDENTMDGFDGDQTAERSDVDVVDFNLLIRTIKLEHDEYQRQQPQQQEGEPIANRILDILRHMNLVGVPLDSTTLRTLLDVYKGKGRMEEDIFNTLLNDPKATPYDDIWLNNLKLSRIVYDDNTKAKQKQRVSMAAQMFLSDDRQQLFPDAPRDTPILANGMTYRILLDALTPHAQHAAMAQRIFDHMRNRGWRPSVVMYEQMVSVWARKMRLQKALATMQVACDDLGWSEVPIKWYTLVLDRLVSQNRLDLAKKWTLEVKKKENLSVDDIFNQRLIRYGLNDSTSTATSQQHH